MHLDVSQIRTLAEVRTFLEGTGAADFRPIHRADVYDCIRRTLDHFDYYQARRPDKSAIKRFLEKVTGLSRAQVTRLISQYRRTGRLVDRRRKPPANRFQRVYTAADVALLAKIDDSQNQLAGPATKVICHRMFHVFGDHDFKRLANISNGAIYNIRKRRDYRAGRLRFRKTVATRVSIGERRKPQPDGKPGYVRVDSVHLGDLEGKKGSYIIDVVDEVTQHEYLVCVERLTHEFLGPALEQLIDAFPFVVHAFHADNGSEYINHRVAELLNRVHVKTLTKSRPRRSHDNALAESKNGAVVRKWLGHVYVAPEMVPHFNAFLGEHLNPLLNYHRPCNFPTETVTPKGRRKLKYRQQDVMTPYDKLKSLPDAEQRLRPGVTFEQLDRIALAKTDLEAGEDAQQALATLLRANREVNAQRAAKTA